MGGLHSSRHGIVEVFLGYSKKVTPQLKVGFILLCGRGDILGIYYLGGSSNLGCLEGVHFYVGVLFHGI